MLKRIMLNLTSIMASPLINSSHQGVATTCIEKMENHWHCYKSKFAQFSSWTPFTICKMQIAAFTILQTMVFLSNILLILWCYCVVDAACILEQQSLSTHHTFLVQDAHIKDKQVTGSPWLFTETSRGLQCIQLAHAM